MEEDTVRVIRGRSLTLAVACFAVSLACGDRCRIIAGHADLEKFKQCLQVVSDAESEKLTKADRTGTPPSRRVAIIGGGIARAAAALNLAAQVRVYSGPSFWYDPLRPSELWQTE